MNTPPASPPTASLVWAVYDLSLPGRADALAKDEAELTALGAVVIVSGKKPRQAHVFLDGVEAEEQWLKNDRWRNILEALRTELASAVDGEVFLRAARRAVWLAARAQKETPPTLLYGAGLAESLVAWLAGKLLAIPFVISIDDDTRWTSKLVAQLQAEAWAVRDASLTAALAVSSSPSA